MTGVEARIWIRLRRRAQDGWKFRRQHPIGPYYVDFCCPADKLIVEINGPAHVDDRWDYDMRRQAWLERLGYRVLRIAVSAIDRDIVAAVETISVALEEHARLGFTPRLPHRGPSVGFADTSP